MTDPRAAASRNVRLTAWSCLGLVVGMVALAFASVPLYDLFCKATGYDGTPLVGSGPSATTAEGTMVVHFDTNVSPALPWRFQPEAPQVEAKLGETKTVFFRVTNTASVPTTGIAAFNVQPGLMGGYFVKIQCFCFSEQTLQPGESMDFPVVFYVDPAVRTDPNTRDYAEMTLSYTYFPSRNGQPTAALATTGAGATRPN